MAHPALDRPVEVQILYIAYEGWIYSGRWADFDGIKIQPFIGNSNRMYFIYIITMILYKIKQQSDKLKKLCHEISIMSQVPVERGQVDDH